MFAQIFIAHLVRSQPLLLYMNPVIANNPTLILSLTRLFLYSFSCFSSDAVCISLSFCCCSIHCRSLTASGSCGASVSRGVCASKYFLMSLPCLASLTAALNASIPRKEEQLPMSSNLSSLVRPAEEHQHRSDRRRRIGINHLCNSGCSSPSRTLAVLGKQG